MTTAAVTSLPLFYIVLGEFDGDLKPELAVANESASSISVFINNTL
jgi:hypothetical protein